MVSESEEVTTEELKAIQEAVKGLRKGLPWLSAADERTRNVYARALFPRSTIGKRQDDPFLRKIYRAKQRGEFTPCDIVEALLVSLGADWIRMSGQGMRL